MPRIISGTARGIILDAPAGLGTRPTSDMAKEALFNILREKYSGGNVLDLFAGTGSLGLEAVSRGAAYCVFVDNDTESIMKIKKNIKKCRMTDETMVLKMDAFKALDSKHVAGRKYSCIFIDPPYGKFSTGLIIEKIAVNDIIEKEGIIVTEHGVKDVPPEKTGGFVCFDRRTYGSVNFSIYRKDAGLLNDQCAQVKE
ncbi:MAG: 16S rRNA (guanine(966)-N(2))-methyltransferase RsmD [Clostridia bacterium]|nr:16S rRNA (guanine(966)-N(2))-methyltransferase RsmD [Clostridia bacterium]